MRETNFTPVIIKGSAALALAPTQSSQTPNVQPSRSMVSANPEILVYAPRKKRRMTVLICETLSTFASVRNLMKVHGQRQFFGVRIDAVAYGANDVLSTSGSLLEIERSLGDKDGVCYTSLGGAFRPKTTYLYWGSISRPAVMALLSLYRANPGWPVKPFVPAYRYMLDTAYGRRLPAAPVTPESSFFLRLEPHFTPMQQSTYRQVLADQLRIPQGIVTERVLRKMARRSC